MAFLHQLCARNMRLREAEKHTLGNTAHGELEQLHTPGRQPGLRTLRAQKGKSPFQTLHRHTQSWGVRSWQFHLSKSL